MTGTGRSKKVLLIHPLGDNWMPGQTDMSRIANILPPIGLLSLTSWLEKHGHQVEIHDCYAHPGREDRIDDYLRSESPDFVGFSTTTSSFPDAARIARRIKSAYPQIRTVFGGVHVSALRQQLMEQYPECDFGVVGEGEEAIQALVESNGEGPGEIAGLLYRDGGEVKFGGFREPTLELDRLPFPAYGKLPGFPRDYTLPIFNYPKAPGTTAITSRGCPYTCSYCDRSVFRRSFRYNSAEYMVELFTHLDDRFGIRHVNFYDDNFAVNKGRVEEFCERMIEARLGMTFNLATRSDHIHDDHLPLLKRAGCWMISMGIETGNADLLDAHRSRGDLELIRSKVATIRGAGIRVKGLFIMGLPGETEESIDQSIDFALGLDLDDINLTKFTPFPGSPLYATVRSQGEFDETWERMNCLNFVFIPRGFTRERLEERYREFYRRYYQRLSVLLGYVAMIWRSPNSWIRFFKNLKDFLAIRRAYKS